MSYTENVDVETIETGEWEKLAKRLAPLQIALAPLGLAPLFVWRDPTATLVSNLVFSLFVVGAVGWVLYGALRPARLDPFVRLLANRARDITSIYLHVSVRNGMRATILTIRTGDGAQAYLAVPNAEGERWLARLEEQLPQATHREGFPPTVTSLI